MLVLASKAVARLESYTARWPMPKIFRLTKGGKLIEGVFKGETINTPSMLCVEDVLDALNWAEEIGGLDALAARSEANLAAVAEWVARTDWVNFLPQSEATRSSTSICLTLSEACPLTGDAKAGAPKKMAQLLEREGIAFDINGYRDAPPGLRLWGGATVDPEDMVALMPWLDWAHATVVAQESAQ